MRVNPLKAASIGAVFLILASVAFVSGAIPSSLLPTAPSLSPSSLDYRLVFAVAFSIFLVLALLLVYLLPSSLSVASSSRTSSNTAQAFLTKPNTVFQSASTSLPYLVADHSLLTVRPGALILPLSSINAPVLPSDTTTSPLAISDTTETASSTPTSDTEPVSKKTSAAVASSKESLSSLSVRWKHSPEDDFQHCPTYYVDAPKESFFEPERAVTLAQLNGDAASSSTETEAMMADLTEADEPILQELIEHGRQQLEDIRRFQLHKIAIAREQAIIRAEALAELEAILKVLQSLAQEARVRANKLSGLPTDDVSLSDRFAKTGRSSRLETVRAIFTEMSRDFFALTYRPLINIDEENWNWKNIIEHIRLNGGHWRTRWAQRVQHCHGNDVFMPFLEVFSQDLGIDIEAVKARVKDAKMAVKGEIEALLPSVKGSNSLNFVQGRPSLGGLLNPIMPFVDSVETILENESTRELGCTRQEVSERVAAVREALEFEALEKTFKGLVICSKIKLLQSICRSAIEKADAFTILEIITALERSKTDLGDKASSILCIAKHEVGKGALSADAVESAKEQLIERIDQVLREGLSAESNEDTPLPLATVDAVREREDEMRAHTDSLQTIRSQIKNKLAELVEVIVIDDLTNEISKSRMTNETSEGFRAREKNIDEVVKGALELNAAAQKLKRKEKLQAPTLENPSMLAMDHDFKRAERVVQGVVGQLYAERTSLAAEIELPPRSQLINSITANEIVQAYNRYRARTRAALISKGILAQQTVAA